MKYFTRPVAALLIVLILLINLIAQLLVVTGIIPSSLNYTEVPTSTLLIAETIAFVFVLFIATIAAIRAELLPIKLQLPEFIFKLFFALMALLFLAVALGNLAGGRPLDYLVLAPIMILAVAASIRLAL